MTMNPTGVLLIIPVFSRHIISLYNVSVSILQNFAKLFMSNERDISCEFFEQYALIRREHIAFSPPSGYVSNME